ncbi:phosphotransferase [Vibrio astriarenae]
MAQNYLAFLSDIGVASINDSERIQSLWSGYGELVRLGISGLEYPSLIIKHVTLPQEMLHPRGWSNARSHQRKVTSYQVESLWYANFCRQVDSRCPMPRSRLNAAGSHHWLIVMDDLANYGFVQTCDKASTHHLSACLYWLAHFHAKYIGNQGGGLWESGTYWHLETRPDELEALDDLPLKSAAKEIDHALKKTPFQTLVHGDAKLANFCFTESGDKAAAVDFQYVGKGCAMKDVALFMSSAVEPEDCSEMESWILDEYFHHLHQAIAHYQPTLSPKEVEQAWRPMFALAWADFQRFVKGWSPNHWKINTYTESLKERALEQLARRDN